MLFLLALLVLSPADRAGLNQKSAAANAAGDYTKAIDFARQAQAACREAGDVPCQAKAVNNEGVAQISRGDYPAALTSFEGALELYRKAGDGEYEIRLLNNIGGVYLFQGRYMEALRRYREAEKRVGESASEPWNPRARQVTLVNLATLYQSIGQEDRALQIYQQLRSARKALSPREEGILISNLGTIYRRLGDPIKAIELYQEAGSRLNSEEGLDASIGVLRNIGVAQALDLHDRNAALSSFSETLKLAGKAGNRRGAMLSLLFRGDLLRTIGKTELARADLNAALALARGLNSSEEEWKALFALGQLDSNMQNYLDAIAVIESVRSRLQATSLRYDFLAAKRDVYDAAIRHTINSGKPDLDALFRLLERTRARTMQEQLALIERTQKSDDILQLRALRARITAKPTAALEAEYEALEQKMSSSGPPVSLAALQHRLDAHTAVLICWSTGADNAVLWITREQSGLHAGPVASLPMVRLSGISTLAIVPDGETWFQSIEAGLIEHYSIFYLPAASMFPQAKPPAMARFPWSKQLIAFADPIRIANPLPASRKEATSIAAQLPGRSQLLLAANNLKRNLHDLSAPLLHFSTHAVADIAAPDRSRILFTPEPGSSEPDFLFLREVYALDLSAVDLVTLSACETQRGKLVQGEGVESFSRAFLLSGANAVITTLWRVDDAPTAEFMKQFYYFLGAGYTKAEALRQAKLKFIRSGGKLAAPQFWAAFVLYGDGLSPIPKFYAWTWFLIAGAAALVVASLLFWNRSHTVTARNE